MDEGNEVGEGTKGVNTRYTEPYIHLYVSLTVVLLVVGPIIIMNNNMQCAAANKFRIILGYTVSISNR